MKKQQNQEDNWLQRFIQTNLGIFLLCFWQVILVAINTYQIANHKWIGIVIFGFLISFFWTYNVSIIAFGTVKQRLIYACGGSTGCLFGSYLTHLIYL